MKSWLWLLLATAQPPQWMVIPAHEDDVVDVQVRESRMVVEVTSPSGTGMAWLRLTEGAWPASVTLRLAGFSELESLRLRSPGHNLRCNLLRIEGLAPGRPCTIDGQSAAAIEERDGSFELLLPPALLPAPGKGLLIEWVDRWR